MENSKNTLLHIKVHKQGT